MTSPDDKGEVQKDIFGDIAFALLIALIVCLLPLGFILDKIPRRGLNHWSKEPGFH